MIKIVNEIPKSDQYKRNNKQNWIAMLVVVDNDRLTDRYVW
jgi:hypothetical protein